MPFFGTTDIFIYPGYKFRFVENLITNFHLPKSTLLMLVSALCSKDIIFNTYKEAVNNKYRFYSFGDAMFIRQKTEDGSQKLEDRRQKTEDGRQKTEDGRRKTEVRRFKKLEILRVRRGGNYRF
jgi:hypothetical protein